MATHNINGKFFSRKLNKICNGFHVRLFPQLRKIYDTKIQLDCMSFEGIDYVCGFEKVLQHHCIMLVCYSNLVKVAISKDWYSWLSNWFGWLADWLTGWLVGWILNCSSLLPGRHYPSIHDHFITITNKMLETCDPYTYDDMCMFFEWQIRYIAWRRVFFKENNSIELICINENEMEWKWNGINFLEMSTEQSEWLTHGWMDIV